ncbi:MAG: GIY-YIG nuclease family protein [Alphaproteobacteria bacterium]|nr:GIY-YIG nuclease family protein [Alphaproteobacteria bacterium]
MFYVYFLKSINFPSQRYIGFSADLKQRLKDHNAGLSRHTAKYTPWELVTYIALSDEQSAKEFEKYMKGGSGQAFANKRFWK